GAPRVGARWLPPPRSRRGWWQEGDVAAQLALAASGRRAPAAAPAGHRPARIVIHAATTATAGITATAAAVEHGECTAEARNHDFGRVALLAALVGPLAGRKLAFDIDLRALAHELLRNLGQFLIQDHDPLPSG